MASIFVILKRACFISAAAGNVLEVLFPQNFLEFYFQLLYEPWFCHRVYILVIRIRGHRNTILKRYFFKHNYAKGVVAPAIVKVLSCQPVHNVLPRLPFQIYFQGMMNGSVEMSCRATQRSDRLYSSLLEARLLDLRGCNDKDPGTKCMPTG